MAATILFLLPFAPYSAGNALTFRSGFIHWDSMRYVALAALLGCAWAYRRLEETLADLEYLTFAAQPMVPEAPAVESSHPASA